MNFLVDAQLPRRMVAWLTATGCDAIHTLDLPGANRTTDEQINDVADREQRVVITKDADFVDSHLLRGRPAKLLQYRPGTSATGTWRHWWCRSSRTLSASSEPTRSLNSAALGW
jgi:predicted nuclease of predicted toxin-antitoxin system